MLKSSNKIHSGKRVPRPSIIPRGNWKLKKPNSSEEFLSNSQPIIAVDTVEFIEEMYQWLLHEHNHDIELCADFVEPSLNDVIMQRQRELAQKREHNWFVAGLTPRIYFIKNKLDENIIQEFSRLCVSGRSAGVFFIFLEDAVPKKLQAEVTYFL